MIAKDIIKDAYENGYAYKVVITLSNGKRKEALYPLSTPKRDGVANLIRQFDDGDEVANASIGLEQKPQKANWTPLRKASVAHIYKDGKEVAVMLKSQFLKSEYRDGDGYVVKMKRESVRG